MTNIVNDIVKSWLGYLRNNEMDIVRINEKDNVGINLLPVAVALRDIQRRGRYQWLPIALFTEDIKSMTAFIPTI